MAVRTRELGLDVALEMGVRVCLERLPGSGREILPGIWVWEVCLDWERKTLLGNGRWAHVPRGVALRAVVSERLVMPCVVHSGAVLIGMGVTGVCSCVCIYNFFFSRMGEHHNWDFNGWYNFSEKVYGKMSSGVKKELKTHVLWWHVGSGRKKSLFRQAQKELFIRKGTEIVRPEPPDKRFYKRPINVTHNRVYRRNENWKRPLDLTVKGCSEFRFSDFGGRVVWKPDFWGVRRVHWCWNLRLKPFVCKIWQWE